jgi:hypothetical protein
MGTLDRLRALVPDFRGIRAGLARPDTRRPAPGTSERVPAHMGGGVAGRVWILPYADPQSNSTGDDATVRAAMRLMLRDPYVKSAWLSQVLTVLSQDFQVHPDADNPKGDLAQEHARFVRHCVERAEGELVGLGSSILMNLGSDGHSLAEKVWDVEARGRYAGKLVLRALKPKDPQYLALVGDEYRNITGVRANRTGETFPISDFTYARYLHTFDEPAGMAAFRGSYGSYWMRDTVRKLRIIHHEKKMGGMIKGTYTDPAEKPGLERALELAKTATWITVPEGVQLEAMALSTASEPDYKSFDESLREETLVGIALAHLHILQGGVSDARGDTKVHKAVSDLGPWLLTYIVQTVLNRQVIPDLLDYNYPVVGNYPRITLGGVSNQEMQELLQFLQGAQAAGFTPSRNYYATALTIQEADPADPEDQLTAPPPGGMGGMVGGPPGADPFGGGGFGLPPGGPPAMPPGPGGATPFGESGWDSFGWDDWKQVGNVWKSPGGRTLTDPVFQRMKGAAAKGAMKPKAKPAAAESAKPKPKRERLVKLVPAPADPPPPLLLNKVQARVVQTLAASGLVPGRTFDGNDLARVLKVSPDALSLHLGDLLRDGVIRPDFGAESKGAFLSRFAPGERWADAQAAPVGKRPAAVPAETLAKAMAGDQPARRSVRAAALSLLDNVFRRLDVFAPLWDDDGGAVNVAALDAASQYALRGLSGAAADGVQGLVKGLAVRPGTGAEPRGLVRAFVGWLGRQSGAVAKQAVRGLARAAWFLAKQAGGYAGGMAKAAFDYYVTDTYHGVKEGAKLGAAGVAAFSAHISLVLGAAALIGSVAFLPPAMPFALKFFAGVGASAAVRYGFGRLVDRTTGRLVAQIEDRQLGNTRFSEDRLGAMANDGVQKFGWVASRSKTGSVKADGAIKERVGWTTRFFVPTGPEGVEVLKRLTANRPVTEVSQVDQLSERPAAFADDPGPPGPPPRPGLRWKRETQRWFRPDRDEPAASSPPPAPPRAAPPTEPQPAKAEGRTPSGRAKMIADEAARIPVTEDVIRPGPMTKNKWEVDPDYGDRRYNFVTSGGAIYRIAAEPGRAGNETGFDVSFTDAGGSVAVTGAGHAHEVFTRVATAVTALIRAKTPAVVTFTAAEPSRVKLYDRLVRALVAVNAGYAAFKLPGRAGSGEYVVVRKELMDKVLATVKDERYANQPAPQILAYAERVGTPLAAELDEAWFTPEGWQDVPAGPARHWCHVAAFAEALPSSELALAGRDGQRAADLLGRAKAAGRTLYAELAERAIRRVLADPDPATVPVLFTDAELKEIADSLAATTATADLLGRSRVHRLADRAKGAAKFAETDWVAFADDPGPPGPPPRPGLTWKRETQRWIKADGAEDDAGDPAAVIRSVLPDADRPESPSGRGRYNLHLPGNRRLQVDLKADGVADINFFNLGGEMGRSGNRLQAGTMDMVRSLKSLAAGLRTVNAGVGYFAPSDRRRAELYARVLADTGFVPARVEYPYGPTGTPRHVWLPAGPDDAANRRKVDEYRRTLEGLAMPERFSEQPDADPFAVFDEAPPAITPVEAVSHFRKLVPTLGIDPARYGPRLERHAFTLAVASDEALLAKVKDVIARQLAAGRSFNPAGDIGDLLDAAGVSPRNPQYAEMVYRTNMNDAYTAGQTAELQSAGMRDLFPAWRYLGIDDERAGDDHRPKFDRLYPSSASFAEVRGPRVYNCRCGMQPVSAGELAQLRAAGERVETSW